MNVENKYYCDGLCEKCKYGKHYTKSKEPYYSCDPKKIDINTVVAPRP